MIDHNIVVVNSKEYKAVAESKYNSCRLCALDNISPVPCWGINCEQKTRSDEQYVIFKPHYRPKASELKW